MALGEFSIRRNLGEIALRMGVVGVVAAALTACSPDQKANEPTPIQNGCPQGAVGVTVFDLEGFKGEKRILNAGDNDMGSIGFANRITSICNQEKAHITITRSDGNPSYFDDTISVLPGGVNNLADSVKVEPKSK